MSPRLGDVDPRGLAREAPARAGHRARGRRNLGSLSSAGRSRAPLSVLVVEDDADARATIAEVLALLGHRVGTAADGPAGLALLATTAPALALIDLELPGLGGLEVARQARRAGGARVYLVALTGRGDAAERSRARAAGFDEHVTKPLDVEALDGLLARATDRRDQSS
jgi:CheY-like chemotaxis protein